MGEWKALGPGTRAVCFGGLEIVPCPTQRRALQRAVGARQFAWLLFGDDQDDEVIDSLRAVSDTTARSHRFAIMGHESDWGRCERWLRRGCDVYLDATSSVPKVLTSLHVSAACGVVVADGCFRPPAPSYQRTRHESRLTGRETEVVRFLASGLSNRDIASRLSLSEHTIEFHVSNILGKLGVHNRGEAADLARVLGL